MYIHHRLTTGKLVKHSFDHFFVAFISLHFHSSLYGEGTSTFRGHQIPFLLRGFYNIDFDNASVRLVGCIEKYHLRMEQLEGVVYPSCKISRCEIDVKNSSVAGEKTPESPEAESEEGHPCTQESKCALDSGANDVELIIYIKVSSQPRLHFIKFLITCTKRPVVS